MVVALIALVFAATGTGIAASGAVTGTNIKNGSITSADLATGAVTSADLATGAVTSADLATGAVTSSDIKDGVILGSDIRGGTLTTKHILDGSLTSNDLDRWTFDPQVLVNLEDARGPAGPAGSSGANGLPGAPAFSNAWINLDFPAAANEVSRFYGDSGPGETTFAAAATTSPTVPTTISNGKVDLLEAPSPDVPTLVEVMFIASLGTPQATAANCTFNPSTETGCTIPGPVTLPAGARLAWRVKVLDAGPNPNWSPFKLGLAYTSAST
jgi:hypothetical protein